MDAVTLRGLLVVMVLWSSAGRAAADENTESDFSETRERKIIKDWNEYDFRLFTFRWGIYSLIDFGTAAQDDDSASQAKVPRDMKIRDFRFTFSGKLATERPITYTMGLMYDGPTDRWFPRETGIQVGIPELWGNVFVGRQKEGISLNKITVGYAVWMMERMPISEATIPVLADGIKWLGGAPNKRANWNVAYFHNDLPKSPATDWYDQAFVARFAVLPLLPDEQGRGSLLHLGAAYHFGQYSDGKAQLHARPESSTAPFFLDTGTFPAKHDHLIGLEAYYRYDSWLAGAEYLFDNIRAPEVGDPFLHGGEAFVAWLVTGETRPYIDLGGKLDFVKPARSVFNGGPGALEAVLHVSYTDLDDGEVQGGTFWRLTPALNWYLDSIASLRLSYGLGYLDRFGVVGRAQFFQGRLEIKLQ